jgi:Ribbon-helix-helix protein, copG family
VAVLSFCGSHGGGDIIDIGGDMTDILIRDVPEDLIDLIDRNARRLGVSRTEYLRRTLARERSYDVTPTTVADFARIAERFSGLDDDELMRRAWT